MFLKTVLADGSAERVFLQEMQKRATVDRNDIEQIVSAIMKDVQQNGYNAVCSYSLQFDGTEPYLVTQDMMQAAYDACTDDVVQALTRAASNIRDYHEQMLVKSWTWERKKGEVLGQTVRGLSKVGVYVPGGTAAYPSTVLMNVIPAKVAGVEEIIMVTPPTENLSKEVLAAAKIAGVNQVIAVGGVQAIAGLSYGAGIIPKVDKIVGPGNAYVAAAKRIAFGSVDIDMIAGPSEVLVIADDAANPKYIAADLLSQAEHDKLASAVLVTTSKVFAAAVSEEMEKQTASLPRQEIIRESIKNHGFCIVVNSLEEACAVANEVAPEHLEIATEEPEALLPLIKNAGAIFLGAYSPEPLGDYMAGPCHVLPTSGTASFFSPLSTDSFLKKTSVISYTRDSLNEYAVQIMTLAKAEHLDAHANAINVRLAEE